MYIDLNNCRIKKLKKPLRTKIELKRKHKKSIASIKPEKIRKTLYNYKVAQNNCKQIIKVHEAKSLESKLIQISKLSKTNLKPYWNIVREHKQNNLEDLYVIKSKKETRLFN